MAEPVLTIVDNFVPNAQELYSALVSDVRWEEHIRARKTASFGQAYNYSGITYDVRPMHPLLVPIVDGLEARLGFRPSNCLLNFYETGDSTMGFHSDSTAELAPGTGVAIVSLGEERSITFHRKEDKQERYSYPLRSGSLLYMTAEVQDHWRHAILKQPGVGGRISLTFRQIEHSTDEAE